MGGYGWSDRLMERWMGGREGRNGWIYRLMERWMGRKVDGKKDG